jgi:NADH-quinone oxidoreductase subunit G
VVILGDAAVTHPQASWLRAIARFVAEATGAAYNELPAGANAIGLAKVGVLPGNGGLDAQAMLAQPRKAYVLYGLELPHDFADGSAVVNALHGTQHIVAFAAFATPELRDVADVILPIGLLPEIDGTLVNVDGFAQHVEAGAKAPGSDVRAGWKVLRALGGQMKLPGFEFARKSVQELSRLATWPIYRSDAVLRRASALQAHPLNRAPAVRVNAEEAQRQGLVEGGQVKLANVVLPLVIDATVPDGAVWIEAAHDQTATLPPYGAAITLSKA